MTIGKRLREERERLKLSQPSMAEVGGTTKQTQYAYETDKTPPKGSYLSKVARLGVDVAYVITGERLENTATTPIELSYLRICRALPDAAARKAGNAALMGVMSSYGVTLADTYPAANDQQHLMAAEPEKNDYLNQHGDKDE